MVHISHCLALALAVSAGAALADPVAQTEAGSVRGIERGAVQAFLGIPYAAPPTGQRRWREPLPVSPWQGHRDATRPGPACYQALAGAWGPYTAEFVAGAPISEDCLTLNIWKPAGGRRGLPVLVFIHGGAFQGGAGSLPVYDGSGLAARGAVVITINYRVGVFGFLAHPGLTAESPLKTSGNYGLLDQIAALRWVRDNAAGFGGNPANVTVSGESAGAASVNDLLVSPLAKGLFARAISFSGASMAIDAPNRIVGESDGAALGKRLDAPSVEVLRAASADRLVEATRMGPAEGGGVPRFVYVPHVDGVVLPHDPSDAAGRVVSAVPLLTGYNAAEMIDLSVRTPADFERAVRGRYGAFADRLQALYPHATEDEVSRSNVLISRDRYMAGLILWSRARTAASGQPVHTYLYDHPYPPARGGKAWGAFHSSGLPYVFGALGHGDRVFTAADHAVSRQWQDIVLAFMRTGNPSLKARAWPKIGATTVNAMVIGDRPGMRPAVSSPARFEAFRAYAAAGGKLGLN
ncbi:carboxylesterase family protein [Novosphingobium flavum]|uniref:Carboxylic ester hydrolase n=1 Tax=Novosphingobium flavum TaxID=1778672 RepID=A0A7X1KLN2_9SPHN|nr:carboxylesterase family protein [Novosphingobium flavum]MBC2665488.1 carboxylesterase family protein [Novosphingobium flavum]